MNESAREAPRARGTVGLFELLVRSRRCVRIYLVGILLALVAGPATAYVVRPVFTSESVLLHRELVQPSALGRDSAEESSRQRGARLRDMVLARANLASLIVELDLFPDERKNGEIQGAIDALLLGVVCKVAEDTFNIRVSYPDRHLAYRATEALAKGLVTAAAEYRKERALATRDFVAAQRDETSRELAAKEEAIAQFIASHPEFAQDPVAPGALGQAGASVRALERRKATSDPTLAALERQRLGIRRRMNSAPVPEAPPPAPMSAEVPAPELVDARRSVERLQEELRALQSRFTDAHPDVVAVRRKYEGAQRDLKAVEARHRGAKPQPEAAVPVSRVDPDEDSRSKRRIAMELRVLDETLEIEKRRRAAERDGLGDELVDLEIEWLALNRALLDARDRHEQLERRFFQASIVASVESTGGASPIVVVDPAFLPERPSARRRSHVVIAAVLVVLGLTVTAAVGVTALQSTQPSKVEFAAESERGMEPFERALVDDGSREADDA